MTVSSAVLIATAAVVTGLVAAPAAGGAPRTAADSTPGTGPPQPATRPAATSQTSPSLTLSAQTSFVTPGQPFDVKVRLGSGALPVADLGLTVAVYPCLSSVSAFDESVSSASGPSGTRISSTRAPLPLSGLPVTNGAYDLSMPVGVGTTPAAPSGGFAIDLTAGGAQCGAYPSGGVYPLRIELVDTNNGQALGGITTHLVYATPSAGTQKLRVGLVLPIQTTLRPAAAPTAAELRGRPAAALAPPTAAALNALSATVTVLTQRASLPVTLEASPQTVVMLGSTGHLSTVEQLASLATTPQGVHDFASSPFVPVDAASLVDAGLQTELGLQVAQGVQVVEANVTHPTAAEEADTAPGHLGTWFSDASLDPATLAQLQSDGYGQVVLPAGSVSTAPTNGSTAEPFTVTTAKGTSMTALAFNNDLSSRFAGASADPVLAAHQLVAELAQTYYEKPNDTAARGVLVTPPGGWPDNPDFVSALLDALGTSPILEAVTTPTMFGTLGPTASCHGGCRLTGTTGTSGLPIDAIRTQRQRINGLAAATPAAPQVGIQLSEVALSGQSESLRPNQQAAVVANASAAVSAQLDQIVVAGDRTITLTSQRGQVPVTVVSAAPYAVTASMTLTSDKLLFADHSTSITVPITLTPSKTTVKYVSVQARASGLFKVDITLRAPVGGMVLSSGQVSVRSTATSLVGIVLSLGAVAVLAAWWIRTSRKRRRARRAAIPIEVPREPVATG